MYLAQGNNTVTPVRLKAVAPRFRVKHSTTEPLRSLFHLCGKGLKRSLAKNAYSIYVSSKSISSQNASHRIHKCMSLCVCLDDLYMMSRRRKPWNTSHRTVAYLDDWLNVSGQTSRLVYLDDWSWVSGRTHPLAGCITIACLVNLQKNKQPLVNGVYQINIFSFLNQNVCYLIEMVLLSTHNIC